MLRQSENTVRIEGIVSEIDINETTFTKNGETKEAIGGKITVRVTQDISGTERELEIPVHCFATKITRKGTPNPAYESIKRVMTNFTSIAAAGGVEGADCIRITNGDLRMNEYYSQNGRLVSFPRVNSSFFQPVKKDELKQEATFNIQMMVTGKTDEVGADGDPTGRYIINGAVVQYGDAVDAFKFYCESPGVINAVSNYWEVGDTVQAHGKLNFSSKTETIVEEAGFGDPIERSRTITVSEPIITGGSQEPLEGDLAYTDSEIRSGLAERKARLDRMKDAVESGANRIKTASAPSKKAGFDDLGF